MKKFTERLDACLLNFFQFISDLFQYLFSGDNFTLVWICVSLELACTGSELICKNIVTTHGHSVSICKAVLFQIALVFSIVGIVFTAKKTCSKHVKNIWEQKFFSMRIFAVTISLPFAIDEYIKCIYRIEGYESFTEDTPEHLINIVSMMRLCEMFLIVCILYFVSCTPKPWSKNPFIKLTMLKA